MKSIKPGRAPSLMGGVMSLLVGLFGIVWTGAAFASGGGVFALFGVIFVIIAIVQAVYHFKNATAKNRYSTYDITDAHEEPDPLSARCGAPGTDAQQGASAAPEGSAPGSLFCPYCGAPAALDYAFCKRCGKRLPD